MLKVVGELVEQGQSLVLATVVAARGSAPRGPGARMAVFPDGRVLGTIGGGRLEERVKAEAAAALGHGRARKLMIDLGPELGMCCGGSVEVFVEPLRAAPRLVIFGGGHVSLPLANLAHDVGFRVTVVDEREDYASRERFPVVSEVLADDPLDVARALELDGSEYLLVITHEHRIDEALLGALVGRPFRYLGLIGSRAKVQRFCQRLLSQGVASGELGRIHAPIGLDIGAETPQEIAVSVVAELIRVRSGAEDRLPEPLACRRGGTRASRVNPEGS